ncbi:MAG: peptidoglycan-binding protein [Lachnospiraceae bacterium]|nr:peptidoglycan-binding protein [Lachnospiraceae bacterium]MEE0920239.1 peptidoglycan-binding protein [Lachnospiraceae bacterium]
MSKLKPAENPNYTGNLTINVTSSIGLIPINNATITISLKSTPQSPILTLTTDNSGQTKTIQLPAPNFSYSQEPGDIQPYTEYNIDVSAPGYETVRVSGTEILPDVNAIQPITMNPLNLAEQNPITSTPEIPSEGEVENILIPDHTLYGDYPAKIPEAEIKPIDESGEIVLSRVVIPEYVIVHDGLPSDSSAPNYYVRYTDYIKNVVSSEIYATWPESTIYANTLAIMSFTLNRVYTEWYRNQGYDFTITSSTAYDQKWIYGRNIYENIDRIVDSIFANYLSRPGVLQPIFTSYCNGTTATCTGLSQWGSKYLGDQGYSPIEIIRYYYGYDMYINSTTYISGVPYSWPGYDLSTGSSGSKVLQLQQQLNRIAQNYPAIPRIQEDGIYGSNTANAIKKFQSIFGLPATGIVDYPTWYKVSEIFVGVSRISEPD